MYEEERERRPMVTNGAQMPPEQLAAAMHKSSVCPMVAPMHADTRPLRNNAEFLQTNVPVLGKAKISALHELKPRLRSGLCIDHQANNNVFNNMHYYAMHYGSGSGNRHFGSS